MIIQSANLSSLAPSSSGTVENMSSPLIDGGVVSEGFSNALVAQIGLLSNIKADGSLLLQAPNPAELQNVNGSQSIVAGLSTGKVDTQDFAALLGNDLPVSSKAKDDVNHEAALAAVTDTLKYITMGTTAGEKAAAVEQNMKDVIAMAAPAEQNMKNIVVAAVPVEQNAADVVAEPEQSVKDVAMDVPVQMVLEQRDDKSDKKQDEVDAQIAFVENNSGAGVLLAAIILPPVMQVEQAKAAKSLTSADTIKMGGLLSFTGDAKPIQSAKVTDDRLQGETVFLQPVQDKQSLNLDRFQLSGQTEKTGLVERQVLSNADHESALAAVTDTLKYITMGVTAGEKAAVVEENMKGAVAMAVPAEKNMRDVVEMAFPVQMDLEHGNDKPDKKQQVQGDTQIAAVENNSGAEVSLAAIILPTVMQAEQAKTANSLTSADTIKMGGLLSFTGDAKPIQSVKVTDDRLQSETVLRQPVQDKQGLNLDYFQISGQTEKTGRVERQVLSLEGETTLSRVGADITQPNRTVVDNKADVPAMAKPLSHPEWSKDLGERIVWMNSKAIPSAEIRLNPPHLGPISVRVDVSDDQATVVFTAQHAAVRETLEASIPKLREMMSAQQLNLVEVNVSQGPASEQGRPQSQNFAQTADGRGQGATAVAVDGIDDVEQEIESGRAMVSKGLLSIYA